MGTRYLLRHLGNMGDLVFFIPPLLATLKRTDPDCHITFVTAWGYKDARGRWGQRNQGGHAIHLLTHDPHIDQLIHWHDTHLDLTARTCIEEGSAFPTWSQAHWDEQKRSTNYDVVAELDFGLSIDDNPLQRIYEAVGMPNETYSNYQLYLSKQDHAVAADVMRDAPRPRIVLLESLAGEATRSWDPAKVSALSKAIEAHYGVAPLHFGSRHIPEYEGRPLTLRENIATLTHADVAIGVMSGPLHFAAAVGVPTITLYCDYPLHRTAPAYFLNEYRTDGALPHRTVLGPSPSQYTLLKGEHAPVPLTPAERDAQDYRSWQHPGRQATKSCLSVITPEEVMATLTDMVPA